MRVIRIVFFSLFIITALISINMIYNLLRDGVGYGMWPVVVVALIYITVQFTGLISVIINRSRVIIGIFTIMTGIVTLLSGFMTFSSLGAPAPKALGIISLISMGASFILFIGYIGLGIILFGLSSKNEIYDKK